MFGFIFILFLLSISPELLENIILICEISKKNDVAPTDLRMCDIKMNVWYKTFY